MSRACVFFYSCVMLLATMLLACSSSGGITFTSTDCQGDSGCSDGKICLNGRCTVPSTPDGDAEDESDSEAPSIPPIIENPCVGQCDIISETAFCMSDDICLCEGTWNYYTCDEICDYLGGQSLGCGASSDGQPFCICDGSDGDIDPQPCIGDCNPGDSPYCLQDDLLCRCDTNSASWETVSCIAECGAAGYADVGYCGFNALDGDQACLCETYIPDCDGPCNELDISFCSTGRELCWCDSYLEWWTLLDCEQICLEAGFAPPAECGYSSDAGHEVCFCSSPGFDPCENAHCDANEICFEGRCLTNCDLIFCDAPQNQEACVGFDIGSQLYGGCMTADAPLCDQPFTPCGERNQKLCIGHFSDNTSRCLDGCPPIANTCPNGLTCLPFETSAGLVEGGCDLIAGWELP